MIDYIKRFFGGNSSAPVIYGEKKEENNFTGKISSLDKRTLLFIFASVFSILIILLVLILLGLGGSEPSQGIDLTEDDNSQTYGSFDESSDYSFGSDEAYPDYSDYSGSGDDYSSNQLDCDPYTDPYCDSYSNSSNSSYSYWEDPGYYNYYDYPLYDTLPDCPAGKCCDGTTNTAQSCSSGLRCCAGSNPIGDCNVSCVTVLPDCPAGKCCNGTTNKVQSCASGLSCCPVSGSSIGECKTSCIIVSGTAPRLTAHYSFENNLTDSVSGADGVYRDYLSNSVAPANFGSGVFGKAVVFNGSGTVQISDVNPVSGYQNFSISVWFYLNKSIPISKYLIAKFSARYYIMASNSTIMSSVVPSSYPADSRLNTASNNKSYGNWHNIVLVRNGTSLLQYYDGLLVSSNYSASEGILSGSTGILQLGGYIFPTCWNAKNCAGFFEGKIDEVKIWDYSLSSQEVLAEYNLLKPSSAISGSMIRLSGNVVRVLKSLYSFK